MSLHKKKRASTEEEDYLPCTETMPSLEVGDHTHDCVGGHFESVLDHFCSTCRKWWGRRADI